MVERLSLFLFGKNPEFTMKLKIYLLIVSCFVSVNVFAQTQIPKKIESDLSESFDKINYWYMQQADDTTGNALDSLFSVNEEFENKFTDYVSKHPFTIKCPFDSLVSAGVEVVNSTDKLLRIYSWDTDLGGQQHNVYNIFQYKTGPETVDLMYNVPETSYSVPADGNEIYDFTVNDKTYYLIHYISGVGINDHFEGVMIYAIEKGKLNTDVKLIKTKSGLHSHLNWHYTYAGSDDSSSASDSVEVFNPKTKTITIPLIDENDHVTDKSITYKFTDQYFEKVK